MSPTPISLAPPSDLGTNVRMLRLGSRISIRELAEQIGVSPSLISKIESGAANPSVEVLRRIAAHLNVSVAEIVDGEQPRAPLDRTSVWERRPAAVVRSDKRKQFTVPDSDIVYQMLTPDAQGEAEIAWVELEPGKGSHAFSVERGQESVTVVRGELTVYVAGDRYVLQTGDCLTFDAATPHKYRNEGQEAVAWFYVAAPPSF